MYTCNLYRLVISNKYPIYVKCISAISIPYAARATLEPCSINGGNLNKFVRYSNFTFNLQCCWNDDLWKIFKMKIVASLSLSLAT